MQTSVQKVFVPKQNETRLDWIRYIVPISTGVRYCLPAGYIRESDKMVAKGVLGYSHQLITRHGYRVALNYDRPDMGIMVDISGSKLNAPDRSAYTINPDEIIDILREYDGHLARIDYAIDIVDGSITPDMIYKMVISGEVKIPSQSVTMVSGDKLIDGILQPAGNTLYLGSRKSDRMLRAYNKALQLRFPDLTWDRLEWEIKGKRAVAIGKAAVKGNKGDLQRIAANEAKTYFKPVNEAADSLLALLNDIVGAAIDFVRGREIENPLAFFDNVVVPFIASNINNIPEDKLANLNAILSAEIKARNQND